MAKKKAGRKVEKPGGSSSGGGSKGAGAENDKTISVDFTWVALGLVVLFASLNYGHEGGVQGSIAELKGMLSGGGGGLTTADAANTPGATKGKRSRKKGGPSPIEVRPQPCDPPLSATRSPARG